MKILKFHRVSWLVADSSRNIKHGGSLRINFHRIREYYRRGGLRNALHPSSILQMKSRVEQFKKGCS